MTGDWPERAAILPRRRLRGWRAGIALCVMALPGFASADVAESAVEHLQARFRAADAWLASHFEQAAVPTAAVAVVHDQEVLWAKGFGYVDEARRIPASPDTRFSICSISKLFTSIAAMRLRDSGALDLDEPLPTYLPGHRLGGTEMSAVTARSILSHVSGLPREADAPYWATREFPDLRRVLQGLDRQDMNAPPFSYFEYSNLGMVLLGETVASLAGTDYETHVQRDLLEPLGLNSTTPRWPGELYGTQLALGYAARNGKGERKVFRFYEIAGLAAAAGFSSTVADLARFASWQFRVLGGEETGLLRAATLREMHRIHWISPDSPEASWGLGFRSVLRRGERAVGHEGGCPGFNSAFILWPARQIAVVLLVNVNDVEVRELALALYDLLAEPIRDVYPAAPPAAAPPDLARYEGVYGRPDYRNFVYVLPEARGLMTIPLNSRSPGEQVERYRHLEGTTFRRVRADGSLAETFRFEVDADGTPVRAWRNSQFLDRQPERG